MKPKNRPRTKRPKTERVKRQPQPNDQVKGEATSTKEELIEKLKKQFGSKERTDMKYFLDHPQIKRNKSFGNGNEPEEVEMTKKEFVSEHKNLIKVLKSPSKKDDKKEAKKQSKELKEVQSKDKSED